MALSQGSASFRLFQFDARIDPDALLQACAADALPPLPLAGLRETAMSGWSSPRFFTDGEINDETCRAGKFVHLSLVKAERKIPKSLLNAYCRAEEVALMREKGLDSVNRATRQQIKEEVSKQLLPKMQPTLKGIDLAIDLERSLLYTDAKSDKQVDALAEAFARAAHTALVPLDAAGAALRRHNVRTDELAPASFTPEDNGDFVVNDPGLDFLTWLFWRFQTGKSSFELPGAGSPHAEIVLDGPVSLVLEAQGAFHTSLSHGTPLLSREFKTALLGGKKIASVKMLLTIGGETWTAGVSAPSFSFTGIKLPPTDKNRDPNAAFLDRMRLLQQLSDSFFALYGAFLAVRADAAAWRRDLAAIAKWMPALEVKA